MEMEHVDLAGTDLRLITWCAGAVCRTACQAASVSRANRAATRMDSTRLLVHNQVTFSVTVRWDS